VKAELQSVLNSRIFRQSRGLAKLLRYICSRALLEDAEPITEYTIAVDVLGKPQDFKESKDSAVRVEVHRLRKRLAEYYVQEGADHRIRIVIPTGQYVPLFQVHEDPVSALPAETQLDVPIALPPTEALELLPPPAPVIPPAPEPVKPRAPFLRVTRIRIAAWVLAISALVVGLQALMRPADALDSLWRPVFSSPDPILLCVGNVQGGTRSAPPKDAANITVSEFHGLASETMLVADAATLSRFAGLLEAKGKRYRVASQSEATFADLQTSPAVLIGLLNNDWTERLVGKLRFTVERLPNGKVVLRDRQNPTRDDWSLDYSMPYLDVTKDYALVVRVLDPKTEQMVVTAAGISVFGTLAAGEFLTDPQEFRKIEGVAPRGWRNKNFEIVISTDVIRGKSGHPNIVAANFW
jgi:hypothetical protein